MNKNIKIAKELVKLAKHLVADAKDIEALAKLLKSTVAGIQDGMHCYKEMPSGLYFATESIEEEGKWILDCCLTKKVDAEGYPLSVDIDLGGIYENDGNIDDQCKKMAEYAYEEDEKLK